jgi:hypothetical protein
MGGNSQDVCPGRRDGRLDGGVVDLADAKRNGGTANTEQQVLGTAPQPVALGVDALWTTKANDGQKPKTAQLRSQTG